MQLLCEAWRCQSRRISMVVPCRQCGNLLERPPNRAKRDCFCNAQHQMAYQYAIGIRNGQQITEKAHDVIRTRGHYKRDDAYLTTRNPATSFEARAKISAYKKRHNWMRG